jgi:phosphoadenosine phosphosulfate reductase
LERFDLRLAHAPKMDRMIAAAERAIETFGSAHVGVSWGKDSVVVAHIARRVAPWMPLVWIREEPFRNPDCMAVRDRFLARCPGMYDEIEAWGRRDDAGRWHATGSIEAGFAEAEHRHGGRYVTGIRAEESATRALRCARWGVSSPNTCAPLARWTGVDVFAYLARFDLPVHPAYAMTFGGALERDRVRVSSLGFRKGRGHGRHEWERHYYGAELAELGLDREFGL